MCSKFQPLKNFGFSVNWSLAILTHRQIERINEGGMCLYDSGLPLARHKLRRNFVAD